MRRPLSEEIVLSPGAAAVLGHRARRKVLAVEKLGGKCHCGYDGLYALRIAFRNNYARLPKQIEAYRNIIKNPVEDESKYEVICLNCLEDEKGRLKEEALNKYEATKITSLHTICLKVFNDAILPIWDGSTPLRNEDIHAALEKRGIHVDRKTMYRYLSYLESIEKVIVQRDPTDLRRKLYTLPFPPKNTMFVKKG